MRRGAAFESWLVNGGAAPADAAERAAHAVWADGFVRGRFGRPLGLASATELAALRAASGDDWPSVEQALRAWFAWVRPAGAPTPLAPALRLVQ